MGSAGVARRVHCPALAPVPDPRGPSNVRDAISPLYRADRDRRRPLSRGVRGRRRWRCPGTPACAQAWVRSVRCLRVLGAVAGHSAVCTGRPTTCSRDHGPGGSTAPGRVRVSDSSDLRPLCTSPSELGTLGPTSPRFFTRELGTVGTTSPGGHCPTPRRLPAHCPPSAPKHHQNRNHQSYQEDEQRKR